MMDGEFEPAMWQGVKKQNHPRPSASKFSFLRQLCNLISSHLVPNLESHCGESLGGRLLSGFEGEQSRGKNTKSS